MRQVNFNFDQDDLEAIAGILYPLGCKPDELDIAIGYLASWGFRYPFVDIYISNSNEAEFTACYRAKADSPPVFVMSAVFNKQSKKYSFHS
jgi:hypothetical protein